MDAPPAVAGWPEDEGGLQARLRPLRQLLPRTFQARLTLGFVGIVTFTLVLVTALSVNRLDDYLAAQEEQIVGTRAAAVANILRVFIERGAGGAPVVAPDNSVNAAVVALLQNGEFMGTLAQIGLADLRVRLGSTTQGASAARPSLVASPGADFRGAYSGSVPKGQTRQATSLSYLFSVEETLTPWAMEITLTRPFTYRTTTIADLTFVVALVELIALVVAILLAAILARRVTQPLRRLSQASAVLAEGDLTERVPADLASAGSLEVAALSRQFNTMAARLEESVEFIRSDRDRSRDFLADVSHELRTPLAALRTFNELLREGAADDPAAREEFLESSSQQIERLDWLAQNLLELSKLDSGLVLLDLRPDDLRSAVESAVEQAEPTARRREIELTLTLPERPVRIRHDPQRIGQVVTNLVGNAIKFTPRGGRVTVELTPYRDGGARIRIADSGVGIDTAELPRIFDRFYRGSRANEARSSGSGLGLAIVRSIVDMHEGRVTVESRLGQGSVFTVYLPHDPRVGEATPEATPEAEADGVGTPEA